MVYRQFVGPALIAGVHRLGCAQHVGHLLLGQVGIFPQITHDFAVVHADASLTLFKILYSVNKFTIDFSKYIYYNSEESRLFMKSQTVSGSMVVYYIQKERGDSFDCLVSTRFIFYSQNKRRYFYG